MKIKNSILFLFIAFCAVQVVNGSLVTDALDAMNTAVNKTATKVKIDIANFYSAAQNISASISSKILEGASSAELGVSTAISKAEELGANVTSCISEGQDGISSIVSSSQAGILICLANATAVMQSDMAEIDSDVQLAGNITSQAVNDYSSCGLFGILCQGQVVAAAGVKGAALAAQVIKAGASVGVDLASAKVAFESCSAAVAAAGISNSTSTYEQEAECIADKVAELVLS